VAIDYPTYDKIINRIRADVLKDLTLLDPTIFASYIKGLTDGLGGRSFDITVLQQQLEKQVFPQTATDEYLERWSNYEDLEKFPATIANGEDNISVTGTATTLLPSGKTLVTSDGNEYITKVGATVSSNSIGITSLTRVGNIVTATTASNHNLATTNSATISGAVETDYNGTFTITVISLTQFQYTISTTPTTPATGTILVAYTNTISTIESVDTGLDKNLDSGAKLTLVTPITGIDNNLYVTFAGVTGGSNIETDERLLVRILSSRANPVANFNVGAITKQAFSVSGVTRVLVKRVYPSIGYVTILFVRDDDDNIIPSAGEIAEVKAAIVELLPAQSSESNVVVEAPTDVTTDYVFSAISPDSSEMREAIGINLAAFYEDTVLFEIDVTEDAYRSAIIETVNAQTGEKLQSFTLTSPTGDISVAAKEIGVLGSVSF
jgi:uncharacterized phage protein gp47/JayE